MSVSESDFDVTSVRADFPLLHTEAYPGVPLVYLDNAATSQKPLAVVEAMEDYYQRYNANVHRGIHRLSEDATARFWAFTYITKGKPALREELLESMLADPSLDLRYEAVALGMRRLSESEDMTDAQQLSRYRELLMAARQPAQIQSIAKRLEELGSPVDLLKHFGFLNSWQVLGTFDNVGQAGFDVQYAPEADYEQAQLDFNKKYSIQIFK